MPLDFNLSYTINLCYNYYIIVSYLSSLYFAYPVLRNQELDFDSVGHLGQIADNMREWEGPIAEGLKLTLTDIEAIKVKHPGKLILQT